MKATILIDNITKDDLISEWGLAVYIEYKGHKFLLDTGASGKFAKNAKGLGIDLADIEYGILSHAHYDHSYGLAEFFKKNTRAKFFLRDGSAEDCYGKKWIFSKYIGIRKGDLERYGDRIEYVSGDYQLMDGVYLIPHKTPGLEVAGKSAHMYRKKSGRWYPDDFSHEQSLVFDTVEGLVIFNSCSHGGADNIIKETATTFPDKKIHTLIGGFHLVGRPEGDIRSLAERIRETGIKRVVTGHCSGEKGFQILKQVLGDRVSQMYCGMILNMEENK
ncbi:MAG: MBL fold metallo-hydrolase [Clostridiales bacterium]|nr:MBL fold metallo-hydrolase [Clostridiales bacterium]